MENRQHKRLMVSLAVRSVQVLAGLIAAIASLFIGSPALMAAPQANLVQQENARPGTAAWQLTDPAIHGEIEGFASLTSVNRGQTIHLFVSTDDPEYRIDVYRMGWYQGTGARLVLGGITRKGFRQPQPAPDPVTGLIECDWDDSYALATVNPGAPDDWRSGVYLAKLTARPSGKSSYIIFVVREDDRASTYLFQSSVTTFQAYNNWGGKSLYTFNSVDRRPARKVSFNRPYAPGVHPLAASGVGAGDFLTASSVPPEFPISPAGWESNMVRWLEREGYDVTYSTNIDTHADARLLAPHNAWLSVGHDEYWTMEMRAHVEAARSGGVNLAFFSANTCYWHIRLEPSFLAQQPNRVMVAYKDKALREDPVELDQDPANDQLATVRWRDRPIGRPEAQLMGVMFFDGGGPVDGDIVIRDDSYWAASGTGLRIGDRLRGLLGYEVDGASEAGADGRHVIAHSPLLANGKPLYADMVAYTPAVGGSVFAVGSLQWSWALDDYNVPAVRSSRLNEPAQQLTRNVLARFAGDDLPVPQIAATGRAGLREALLFDGSRSVDRDGAIVDWRWDFGDGSGAGGTTVHHRYEAAGHFVVRLTVRDDRGAAQTTSATVDICVAAPPASADRDCSEPGMRVAPPAGSPDAR